MLQLLIGCLVLAAPLDGLASDSSAPPTLAESAASEPILQNFNLEMRILRNKVANGDVSAAYELAATIKSLDGGELEDSLIALGEFSEKNMSQFFAIYNLGLLNDENISDSAVMTDPNLTEDSAKLRLLLARRKVQAEAFVVASDTRRGALIYISAITRFLESVR